jgi:hypothetical protein
MAKSRGEVLRETGEADAFELSQRRNTIALSANLNSDSERAAAIYATMTTGDLERLRAAFRMDQGATGNAIAIAFAQGRIDLIAAELARRGDPHSHLDYALR